MGKKITMTMEEIMAAMDNVHNVGDLQDLIAQLPRTMEVRQRGGAGNWRLGAEIRVRKLARHKQDTTYVADLRGDKTWSKAKKNFGPEFDCLTID